MNRRRDGADENTRIYTYKRAPFLPSYGTNLSAPLLFLFSIFGPLCRSNVVSDDVKCNLTFFFHRLDVELCMAVGAKSLDRGFDQ